MGATEQEKPQRLPTKKTGMDIAASLARAAVGAVPLGGQAGIELLSLITPPLQRAREEFINDLASRLAQVEQVADDETLASFVMATAQRAMATSSKEKRDLLRNAALNVAIGEGDRADYFLGLIESMALEHIWILRFFGEPHPGTDRLRPAYLVDDVCPHIQGQIPALADHAELVQTVVHDLINRGLLQFPRVAPTTLGPGQEKLYELDSSRLSRLGQQFMEFVTEPLLLS